MIEYDFIYGFMNKINIIWTLNHQPWAAKPSFSLWNRQTDLTKGSSFFSAAQWRTFGRWNRHKHADFEHAAGI